MLSHKRKDGYLVFQHSIPDEYKDVVERCLRKEMKETVKLMSKNDCIGICYHPTRKVCGVLSIPLFDPTSERFEGEIVSW